MTAKGDDSEERQRRGEMTETKGEMTAAGQHKLTVGDPRYPHIVASNCSQLVCTFFYFLNFLFVLIINSGSQTSLMLNVLRYSRLPHNPYPSVDSPGYGL